MKHFGWTPEQIDKMSARDYHSTIKAINKWLVPPKNDR